MKCSVAGCGLCQSKNRPNLTFHRLPRNECRRREWLENIGLENIRPGTRDIHVCSLHFEESAFNKTLNIIRLRDDAIPTVFAKADQVLNSGGGEGAAALPAPPGQYTQIDDQTKPVPPSEVPKPEEVKVPENQDQLNKETPGPEQNPAEVKPAETQAGATVNDATPQQQLQDWHQKEAELLKKITELETVKKERTEESLKFELKVREDEIDLLKARVKNLETELQAALSKPSGKNHEMIENIKQQHEELLSKARGMIFDKTKMVKNQELQIEALTTQVASLKDINQITKDLLEIRNSEVKAMEERYQAMDARYKAEKERHSLVLQRAQNSSNINEDLRKEYETQLAIFKELRSKYEERVKGLALENERLKSSLAPNDSGPSK